MNTKNLSNLIWSVADLLRGDYKRSDFGRVILPFTLLARIESVLSPTREAVYEEYEKRKKLNIPLAPLLTLKSGHQFYNTSTFSLASLLGDADNLKDNMASYLEAFSDNVKDIFARFKFLEQVHYLDEANLLFKLVEKFSSSSLDLSPSNVSNYEMGNLFEELIRKFAEESNETAGEHFIMSSLYFSNECHLRKSA